MYYFRLTGGIGNQLFQYAAAKTVALKTGIPFKVYFEDTNQFASRSYQLNEFRIHPAHADANEIPKENFWAKIKRKLNIVHFFYEKQNFKYDSDIYLQKRNTFFVGYWQNPSYFADIEELLFKELQLKNISNDTQALAHEIALKEHTIAIHVRRGDYLSNPAANTFHGTCDITYYMQALQYFNDFANKHFYLFSDDSNWAEKNFDFLESKKIIAYNHTAPAEDLYLMSQCKHQIIANSTFSWWAAWLNRYPHKIVIAPQKWTNYHNDCNILPKEWIRV